MAAYDPLPGLEMLANHRNDRIGKNRFPRANDARVRDGLIFPHIDPTFQIAKGQTAFTIGSCFAREIEKRLPGFTIPTLGLDVPERYVGGARNSLLNEFNPGSIAQRIEWATQGTDTQTLDDTFSMDKDVGRDLLLAKGLPLVMDELLQVRGMVDGIYRALPGADVLIITLGMTKVWYDHQTDLYLNRMPHPRDIRKDPGRYAHLNLSVADTVKMLSEALERGFENGVKNVLLTVSPVPLQTTSQPVDCVIDNALSKSVLRVAAYEIATAFPGQVDYFPSYEIVQSGGLHAFKEDHVHVRAEVVAAVTGYMLTQYLQEE